MGRPRAFDLKEMNSIASTLSNVAARFCRGGFGQIQSYLLRGYRWLAAVLLGTVLLSAVGYGIVTVTYLLNSRWIAPLVLAKSDTRVAALAAQIFTAKQNRDAIKGELDSADQGRHLLQAQHDWLSDIIGRYERSLEFEKKADGKLNDRLKQLITNKRVVDAKTADMVAANRKLSAGIDQELQAGLITADTAMASKAQLVSSEAALSAGEIGTATLDHQISQLTRGVNSLAGGNSSPQALQNLAQLGVLKQELSDTDLKLARLNADVAAKSRQIGELDALLGSLTGSPFYMAAYGEKDVHRFAFVPYDNEGAVRVGAPVYACKLQIIGCAKVGTIKSITNEEEHVQHPLFNSQIRGVLVELDLKDEQAAKNLTLFVGHSPFYVL
jgi:hypothetical protein